MRAVKRCKWIPSLNLNILMSLSWLWIYLGGNDIWPDKKLPDLEYANDFVMVSEDASKLQVIRDHPQDCVDDFTRPFAIPNGKSKICVKTFFVVENRCYYHWVECDGRILSADCWFIRTFRGLRFSSVEQASYCNCLR